MWTACANSASIWKSSRRRTCAGLWPGLISQGRTTPAHSNSSERKFVFLLFDTCLLDFVEAGSYD
jgi:hypothetical protein